MAQATKQETPEKDPEQLALFDWGGPNMAKLRIAADALTTASRSPNTLKAYEDDWRNFRDWCQSTSRSALPAKPDTVRLYVAWVLSDHKVNTANRRIAAIRHMHRLNRETMPDLSEARDLLRGARRDARHKPTEKKAMTIELLRRIVDALPDSRIGLRDRAVLLIGFASGMRRSEIVQLNIEDLAMHAKGVAATIRRSKTDQQNVGRIVGIFAGKRASTCPVRALEKWLKTLDRTTGPLFVGCRTGQKKEVRLGSLTIGELVKKGVQSVGLDPTEYAGHSLRAGHVTAAVEAGTPELLIMQGTGHKSVAMLQRYVRPASIWARNPLARAL